WYAASSRGACHAAWWLLLAPRTARGLRCVLVGRLIRFVGGLLAGERRGHGGELARVLREHRGERVRAPLECIDDRLPRGGVLARVVDDLRGQAAQPDRLRDQLA